jgi:GNAT superfamily N-acetyltransferase
VPDDLELVELGRLSLGDWLDLTERDPAAFGPSTASLIYRDKDRHLGLRSPDGRLAAVLGMTVAGIEIEGHEPFGVVGMGSLIVRRESRGRDLSGVLSRAARSRASQLGHDRAMLFCEPELVELHRRRGYALIDARVTVDQPGGRIEMPIPAMWRPIRPCEWPSGHVDVVGLPF